MSTRAANTPSKSGRGDAPRKSGRESEPLADEARRILRAEMIRRGFNYKRLAALVEPAEGETSESLQTLINKVNRGRFSFAFMLRMCRAMGITNLNLTPVVDLVERKSGGGE